MRAGWVLAAAAVAGPGGAFGQVVPAYHSLPGADATVYLDFDGDFTPNWGQFHPGQTPAYSIDGDTTSFSQQELDNIREIWMRVAEKFSPFNLNITTVDPGNRDNLETIHVVIGGDGQNGAANYWLGVRAGGIAHVGAFYNSFPNTVFVFPGNLLNGDPKRVAEASAHESGHGFGLNHQTLFDSLGNLITEYNPGDSERAPIMGRSYESARGLWWRGTWLTPTFIQDDLQVLSAPGNGYGLRADDHADAPAGATPMAAQGDSVTARGIIETVADVDQFIFETLSGEVSFTLDVAPFGPMLDASLALLDLDGNILMSAATSSLGETLSASLVGGTYALAVSSAGGYGDIGQYWLSGTIVAVPEPGTSTFAAVGLAAMFLGRRRRGARLSGVCARTSGK